jgi:type III pantothenate kinase
VTSLLVDIGNSRIKWATLTAEGLSCSGARAYAAASLPQVLTQAWSRLARPQRVPICSVAGNEANRQVARGMEQAWGMRPEYLRAEAEAYGIVNAYADPQTLGADRWAAMIGAHQRRPGPCCIVDYGSAITSDLLDADGRHLGGRIAPGLGMMLRALTTGTDALSALVDAAALSSEALDSGIPDPGTSTRDCIVSGLLHAALAPTLQLLQTAAKRFSSAPSLIVTGGDAQLLLPHLPADTHHEPDLVLLGLAAVHNLADAPLS